MSDGFSQECLTAMRQAEVMLPWYNMQCDKWHMRPVDKFLHIMDYLPITLDSGILSSSIPFDQGLQMVDQDRILAYIFSCDLRNMIINHVQDYYSDVINQDDKDTLQLFVDMNNIQMKKLEARLLEVRDGKAQPQIWRN